MDFVKRLGYKISGTLDDCVLLEEDTSRGQPRVTANRVGLSESTIPLRVAAEQMGVSGQRIPLHAPGYENARRITLYNHFMGSLADLEVATDEQAGVIRAVLDGDNTRAQAYLLESLVREGTEHGYSELRITPVSNPMAYWIISHRKPALSRHQSGFEWNLDLSDETNATGTSDVLYPMHRMNVLFKLHQRLYKSKANKTMDASEEDLWYPINAFRDGCSPNVAVFYPEEQINMELYQKGWFGRRKNAEKSLAGELAYRKKLDMPYSILQLAFNAKDPDDIWSVANTLNALGNQVARGEDQRPLILLIPKSDITTEMARHEERNGLIVPVSAYGLGYNIITGGQPLYEVISSNQNV